MPAWIQKEYIMSKQISFTNRKADLRSRSISWQVFDTASYDIHVHKLNRLDPNETNVNAYQEKRRNKQNKTPLKTFKNHH